MNLWWRLLILILTTRWRPRLPAPFGVSLLKFRVWPGDLDTSLHMNNGRYWSLMDLGRTDLMLRSGLWRIVVRHRWVPVISTAAIRFRRELRAGSSFKLETRVLGWDQRRFVIRHDMLRTEDGVVVATALVRGGFYDRRSRKFIDVKEVFRSLDLTARSPDLSPAEMLVEVERLLQAPIPDAA